jgi:outer membrane protein TolC
MALSLLLVAGTVGCTRHFFRKQADKEVAEVLTEKDRYPDWRIEQYHVYPDPRARFADPTNPDRPPMPPDDPAAWCLSPHPQRIPHAGVQYVDGTGYLALLAEWDEQNRAETAQAKKAVEAKRTPDRQPAEGKTEKTPTMPRELPEAASKTNGLAAAPGAAATASAASTTSLSSKAGARPPYLLKLEQAVELGLINSREYQDRREDLYLTALPVTLERFSFAVQLFAAEEAIREWAGRQTTPEGHQNNWTLNSNAGFAKLFSTGALLLFNFANQTVFNLTGHGPDVLSQSTINLDLIQPFLRGGGRAVTLEPLTQAERDLLYEIRSFARFRKEFYVAIAGGGGGSITGASFQPTGVIAPTPFSPGAGVGGSSGLIPGIIPAVPVNGNPGLQIDPGISGRAPLNTAFAAPVSGYLTTLLQAAQMQVDEYNIEKLESFLALTKAMEEGGDVSKLQVDQFEQQVLGARTSLLTDQLQYLQSLDQLKLQLGLPTDLPIELENAPFRPLTDQFQRYENLFKEFDAAQRAPERFGTPELAAKVRGEFHRIFASAPLVRGTRFRTQVEASWSTLEKLSADQLKKRLAGLYEERRQLRARQDVLQARGQQLTPAEEQRLNTLNFEIYLGEFEQQLRDYEGQPWRNLLDPALQVRRQKLMYRYVVSAFILVLTDARNERLDQLRQQWPDLAKLCVNGVDLLKADLDEAQAAVVQTALLNRLDLMNVRAELTDSWRQLAVFANALLAPFNVQYHVDSSTPTGQAKPLAFNASRTRQQLILNTELPLVRMSERNNYRASLINFQRVRRILQRAEDQVAFDTRGEIRQLRQQEENYRIQQRQVELAYLTVENSLDTFQAPPQVFPSGAGGTTGGAGGGGGNIDVATRAASLTNQLIQAQSSLYRAQFTMTTIWITYLNTRLQLYRDMELMPLDYRGVWIDDIATSQCPAGDSPSRPGSGQCQPGSPESVSQRRDRPEQWLPAAEPVTAAPGPALEQTR